MSWRIRILHRTGYHYASAVEASYNEARITPLSTPRQLTLESSVEISPSAGIYRYWDYWSTLVHAFDVHVPHSELVVTGTSVVETTPEDPVEITLGWDDLHQRSVTDRFAELLAATAHVPFDPAVTAPARELASGLDPRTSCDAVVDWVRSQLRYERGTTNVSSSGTEALAHGVGVCQDFAHLTLAALRTLGIPARYVSGYLYPDTEAEVGDTVQGESHAWVEAWIGDWVELEPTSSSEVGYRHVVVGRGRDYTDVAPLKGVYRGGECTALGVSVELTRLA